MRTKFFISVFFLFFILNPLSADGGYYKTAGHKRKSVDPWIVPELVGGFMGGAFGCGSIGSLAGLTQSPQLVITGLTVGGAAGSALLVYGIGNWLGKRKGNFKTTFWSGMIAGLTGFAVNYVFSDRNWADNLFSPSSKDWTDIAGGTMFFNIVLIPIGATIGYNLSKEKK